jgi:hypothetical protein
MHKNKMSITGHTEYEITWSSIKTSARGFVWVWNLVADNEGGTQAEGVWE